MSRYDFEHNVFAAIVDVVGSRCTLFADNKIWKIWKIWAIILWVSYMKSLMLYSFFVPRKDGTML